MVRPATVIVGSTSRLARAYQEAHPEKDFVLAGRAEIESWVTTESISRAWAAYVAALNRPLSDVMLFAAVTDNSIDPDLMNRVNVDLPVGIMDAVAPSGLPVTTFGSVLERQSAESSAYLTSKLRLAREVEKRRRDGERVTHVRFHTMYGAGRPSPHMFLGQALAALESGSSFSMSAGTQARQYQHVDDLIAAIDCVLAEDDKSIYEISSAETNTLREIALSIFGYFDALDRLNIGALALHANEAFDPEYEQDATYERVTFRPTLPAINQYLERFLPRDGLRVI
jgi:nucleoside-diphosphate-sugar epimerase